MHIFKRNAISMCVCTPDRCVFIAFLFGRGDAMGIFGDMIGGARENIRWDAATRLRDSSNRRR